MAHPAPRASRLAATRLPLAGLSLAVVLGLAGCASSPRDSAPGRAPDLTALQDAEPRVEPIRSAGGTSKPYTVLGQSYSPITDDRAFRENGLASWYGTKFHAQPTASGEPYDMYAMTAAHKTLPLPSYVRVRNPANGREAIVRVNDRGPFHEGRVIDLSWAAASKLDLLRGVAPVEIERITNQEIRAGTWRRDAGAPATALAAAPAATTSGPPLDTAPRAAGEVAVPAALTVPVVAAAQPEAVALPALAPAAGMDAVAPRSELPPAAAPLAPAAGFWIQLGAFSQRDSAANLREQAARGVPSTAALLQVFNERGMYRVQAGPYASREAAGGAAEQLRLALRVAPFVLERR